MNAFPRGESWRQNVELVGYHDLDAKPAFKLQILETGGRWYLYIAHLWHRGWSIVEVTDPTAPKLVRFIDGPPNTWTLQIQVADGRMITGLEQMPADWGGDPKKGYQEGIYIWDLSDPEDPVRRGHFKTGATGTHRNYYDGGRYAHLTAGAPGYEGRIYRIVDIGDPEVPVEVGRWWVPGQWKAGGESGAPPFSSLHGGPYIEGERAYLPYRGAGMVILDISDYAKPKFVSGFRVSPPFMALFGIHSAIPFPSRRLVAANSEAIRENCDEALCFAGLVDVSKEEAPRLVSILPTPAAPPAAPFRNFCEFGGRFGPHNQHQPQHQRALLDRDDLLFMTWFNAGLRIFDISDPVMPREVGYFVPPVPRQRRGIFPKTMTPQSEDLIVDARGNIYISDKNHGVYIVRPSDEIMH